MKKPNNKHKTAVVSIQMKSVWGPEPTFEEGHTLTSIELSNTLGWYHNMEDLQASKDYLLEYLKQRKDPRYKLIRSNAPTAIRPTAGFVARILTNGYFLEETEHPVFDRLVNESCKQVVVEIDPENFPKASVQDRVTAKVADIISDLEEVLDAWEDNKEFSSYDFLNARQTPPRLVEMVSEYYMPLMNEVSGIMKDKVLREAYSHMSQPRLDSYIKFVTSFYNEMIRYCGVAKAATVRKTRKSTKRVDPLKTFKYLKESNELKLKSIDPMKIIGASEVWMFDTLAFRIVVLRTDKHAGLDIKGTTIINTDEARCETKKLRRSRMDFLEGIVPATKTAAKKKFDDLNTGVAKPTSRTNDNMIILKVYK